MQREHRKESVRHRKHERALMVKAGLRQGPGGSAAAAAGGDPAAAGQGPEEEEEAIVSKGHVITYCALDYPRIVDSVRWRIATMKANLKVRLPACLTVTISTQLQTRSGSRHVAICDSSVPLQCTWHTVVP